jgi:hypothetical protein
MLPCSCHSSAGSGGAAAGAGPAQASAGGGGAGLETPSPGLVQGEVVHGGAISRGEHLVAQGSGVGCDPHVAVLQLHGLKDSRLEEMDVRGEPRAAVPCGRRGGGGGGRTGRVGKFCAELERSWADTQPATHQ